MSLKRRTKDEVPSSSSSTFFERLAFSDTFSSANKKSYRWQEKYNQKGIRNINEPAPRRVLQNPPFLNNPASNETISSTRRNDDGGDKASKISTPQLTERKKEKGKVTISLVFDRLALAETVSSARRKKIFHNDNNKEIGEAKQPSLIKEALFNRLASTETFSSARRKVSSLEEENLKILIPQVSSSTSSIFNRLASTETVASKGLKDNSKNEEKEGEALKNLLLQTLITSSSPPNPSPHSTPHSKSYSNPHSNFKTSPTNSNIPQKDNLKIVLPQTMSMSTSPMFHKLASVKAVKTFRNEEKSYNIIQSQIFNRLASTDTVASKGLKQNLKSEQKIVKHTPMQDSLAIDLSQREPMDLKMIPQNLSTCVFTRLALTETISYKCLKYNAKIEPENVNKDHTKVTSSSRRVPEHKTPSSDIYQYLKIEEGEMKDDIKDNDVFNVQSIVAGVEAKKALASIWLKDSMHATIEKHETESDKENNEEDTVLYAEHPAIINVSVHKSEKTIEKKKDCEEEENTRDAQLSLVHIDSINGQMKPKEKDTEKNCSSKVKTSSMKNDCVFDRLARTGTASSLRKNRKSKTFHQDCMAYSESRSMKLLLR